VKPPFSCEKREQHPRTLSRKRTTKVVRSAGLRCSIERPVLFNRTTRVVHLQAADRSEDCSNVRLAHPPTCAGSDMATGSPRLAEEEEEIENL